MSDFKLKDFVRESNRIERILREPTWQELDAHELLLSMKGLSISDLTYFVARVQPGAVLRDKPGLDVYVGNHVPPPGGPEIVPALERILEQARIYRDTAFHRHMAYETLHPFTDGNGRSGRALWLWMMGGIDGAPLGFLHTFYYQSLSNWREP